jgi:hypothetical protein
MHRVGLAVALAAIIGCSSDPPPARPLTAEELEKVKQEDALNDADEMSGGTGKMPPTKDRKSR